MIRLLSFLFLINTFSNFIVFSSVTTSKPNPAANFFFDIDGISIANGHEHICVIEQKHATDAIGESLGSVGGIGGRVQCWGFDYSGSIDPPRDVEFMQIVAGMGFTCGITMEQTVVCWGVINGQLSGLYKQITADNSDYYACGILIDGAIVCWGHAQVIHEIKKNVPTNTEFVQISCASHHCCTLDTHARPHCWGFGSLGEMNPPLDLPSQQMTSLPPLDTLGDTELEITEVDSVFNGTDVTKRMQFSQIAVASTFSCGITLESHHLLCWGLEKGNIRLAKTIPRVVTGPFRQLSAGSQGVCVIRDGTDTPTNATYHQPGVKTVRSLNDKRPFHDLLTAAGVGLHPSGEDDGDLHDASSVPDSLTCWGAAQNLVDLKAMNSMEEDEKQEDRGWDQVSVGSTNVCAVSLDSELVCWGTNLPAEFKDYHKKFIVA